MKIKEGARGTDAAFYKLMNVSGAAVLKLLEVEQPETYTAKAVVLKDKQLFPDIQAWPLMEGGQELIFIEFQGYEDRMIRYRLAAKLTMSCAHENYDGAVRAGIIFTDHRYQGVAVPLDIASIDKKAWVRGQFIEVVLDSYSEDQLLSIDPRLIILAPFTVSGDVSTQDMIRLGRRWSDRACAIYPKERHRDVLDAMALFILSRFRKLNREEVIAMLDFDLADTAVGQELIELGKEEGIKEGKEEGIKEGSLRRAREMLLDGLTARFGIVPEDIAESIEDIKAAESLRALHFQLFKCDDLEAFRSFLMAVKRKL